MKWQEYCECLQVFTKAFYQPTKGQADQGFMYWRYKPKQELLDHILINNIPDITHFNKAPPPIKSIEFKPEHYEQSDDYLTKYLQSIGASSLKDAFEKALKK